MLSLGKASHIINYGDFVIVREIRSVAVLGAGTMGAGIAGLCAQQDCRVLMLDVSIEEAEKGLERIVSGRPPAVDDVAKAKNITLGTFDRDLDKLNEYDWVCEAIIEDLGKKRELMARVEPLRKNGSVVSTNTSGILLSEITRGMPERLCRDIAVTHFFNPVKVMRLMELVPGKDTDDEVIESLSEFCGGVLNKGVVHAKDTVNFIGNRIGCFWMLLGLHKASAQNNELSIELIDALMSVPFGLPRTGLFGLIDLIGLDVMELVGRNLAENLSPNDAGINFTNLPPAEKVMLKRGQVGRKSGGGFYRVRKLDDGSKLKEVFDFAADEWRGISEIVLNSPSSIQDTIFAEDAEGRFCWQVMGGMLCYAADLVPEISNDVVNIDRAMRWGFGWESGPFEMLDLIGPDRFIKRLEADKIKVPKMLDVLRGVSVETFYCNDGQEFLGYDGKYHSLIVK